ncbi:uncharacterized protein TM35_000341820 [Trypanosoma theileri]|uniref:Uncharacterized protein n=1 Tax=Trypanosoma theileri TaxID=67003 RepID=A0A1X0NN53_9TRYP|nr:uncharacterized protein TM35_000341820 [Trypanosoma theileri]ORC85570.1 hypothetical protein TM35_000341820 [Trypanosoma theileri]
MCDDDVRLGPHVIVMCFLLYCCCCCRQREETSVKEGASLERQFLQLGEDPLMWDTQFRDVTSEESHDSSHFPASPPPSPVDVEKKKSVKFSMLSPLNSNLHLHNEPGVPVRGIIKDPSRNIGRRSNQV